MSDTTVPADSTPPTTTPPANIPPGWYDEGTGSGRMRWWSGAEWTEHVAAPASTLRLVRPVLPADRPVYSPWIWLIVLLPLLSYLSFLLWQPSFDYLNDLPSTADPSSAGTITSIYSSMFGSFFTPGYFIILFLGWAIYGATVVFAWRDVVWLRAKGVVLPFAWPWAFLGSLVYVIGRTVIVYRVAKPRGRAPIWVLIAVFVAGLIIIGVWEAMLMSSVFSHLPDYSAYSS